MQVLKRGNLRQGAEGQAAWRFALALSRGHEGEGARSAPSRGQDGTKKVRPL